jgi:hypothetical protein
MAQAGAGGQGGSAGTASAGQSGGAGQAGNAGQGGSGTGYDQTLFDNVRINSHSDQPNFQHATTDFEIKEKEFSKVTLVVDLESTCYPFEKWLDNPPPSGENWPADCDAFDRNFEFTLDEPDPMAGGPPAIELVRAITPFGGPLHLEIDVTDVFNGLPGKHSMKTQISTWSDGAGKVSGSNGGWNVTAKLHVEPGAAPRKVLAVVPLYNLNHDGSTVVMPVPITPPEGTTSAKIEYRATGHGGGSDPSCFGPAEEFCNRVHWMYIDDTAVYKKQLLRNDCSDLCTMKTHKWPSGQTMTYCGENPCGSIQSVNANRANWCPGSLTPPQILEHALLSTPGTHQYRYDIPKIVASGGSWRLSAVYFAYGE